MPSRSSSSVLIALLALAGLLPAQEPRPLRAATDLAARLGTADARRVELVLPADLPDALRLTLVDPDGAPLHASLERLDLRAPGGWLRVVGADGLRADVPLPVATTYRGVLREDPGAVVVASLRPEGLRAEVLGAAGGDWRVEPLAGIDPFAGRAEHAVLRAAAAPAPAWACGIDADPARWLGDALQVHGGRDGQAHTDDAADDHADDGSASTADPAGAPVGPAGPAGPDDPDDPAQPVTLGGGPGVSPGLDARASGARSATLPGAGGLQPSQCGLRCEIAFDADFEYFQAKGSVDDVVAAIDLMLAQVDAFYARDLGVTFTLTAVVVRTAPYYAPTGGGNLLDLFRAEWNGNLADVPRDIAHLMTGKPGSLIEFGGLAWVGALCGGIGYGWSMDGANIVGHEVGHNFGAGHCHDESPCNNMCGACFWIGPVTRGVKLGHMASVGCLEPLGVGLPQVAPYVLPDTLVLRKSAFDDAPVHAVDVLANDFDSNCEPVFVDSADATSARGGSVTVSPGTGPGGRDELVYGLPAVPFVGVDEFAYATRDAFGHVNTSSVRVDVRALDLLGAWPLDDGAGGGAADATPAGHDGQLAGGAAWTSGPWNGALMLDGVDDHVDVPPLGATLDEATFTAWVRPVGGGFPYAGLVFARGGTTASGLHLGFGQELRYTWNGDSASTNWVSGLQLPLGAWSFVALTVRPDRATLWMHDGAAWQSATRTAVHAPETLDGGLGIGHDALLVLRHFPGDVDDVRVFDWAFDADELEQLRAFGGRAGGPAPRDGGLLVVAEQGLAWAPGALADSQRLYLGSDFAAVRDATPGAPEDMGLLASSAFDPGPIVGGPWFWRVDQGVGTATLAGDVWQFDAPDVTRYRLDEASGPVSTADQGDVLSAAGSTTFGAPGASAATGSAVFLDGSGDFLQGASPIGPGDTLTLTAWIRKDGPNSAWDGLVFWRGGSTVAGLNFGNGQELRYHWDGGQWGWDSGLVPPDDTWVFVALVVRPEAATIWWGDGVTLSSATRAAGHAAEAFDASLQLGRDPAGGREFRGWIDDVRVFREALSADEIASIHAATAP